MVKLRMLLGAWAIICLCMLVCYGCKEGGDTIVTTLPMNTAPVVAAIPAQAADVGVPFSLDLSTYISDDHDAIGSLVLAVISGGGTITTGVYDNTFAAAGTFTVRFIVGDTEGKTTVASFDVTVTAAPNSAPVIAAIPDQSIVADQELILNLAYYLSDDNDTLADLLTVVTSGGGAVNGLIYTNTWTAEGTYTVNITVQDSGGLTTAGSFNVIVYEQPVAAFTSSVTAGPAPLTVNFTDQSTGGVTAWAWDFDNNGVTDSTVQNPSYAYTAAGTYSVKLTVTGPGGSGSVIKTSFVQVPTTVWYVDDAIVSSGTGTTWLQAFKTLEEGIGAAAAGDMVLVADGTYTGASNRDLDFGGVDLTLRAYGSNCVIDCEGQDRAFYFQTAETNAAVVYGFTITDANQDTENGGAVYCDGASPSFVNCYFVDNYCDTDNYYGGVFYCYGGSIAVIDCTLIGNQAYQGACFYLEEGSNAIITNCVFQNNLAPDYAGVMYLYHSHPTVTNCLFERNMSDYGSVVYAEEYSNATFLTCTFDYNVGYDYGAIYINYGDLIVDGCVFRSNTAYDYSAAISAYDYCSVTINNTLFEGNAAYEDGTAIYCYSYCDGTVTNCTFTGNSSYYSIVSIYDDCGVDFSYCTFYNNVAYDYGSMYIYDSPCTIDNCNFYNNTSEYGAGMYIDSDDPPTITNCTFTGNSAYEGGALYVYYTDQQITGCTFTGNKASEYGGAIYATGSTGTEYTLTLTNCTIDQNLTGDEAAGIYCQYYNLKATNTSISRNNSAYYYGGIYFNGYSSHTNTLELTGCTIDNNITGYDGGGIYANYCSATIVNTSISGNLAGDEYSALRVGNGSGRLWKWNNCTISNNLAGYGYGYYISSVDTEFTNCTIQGNMCPDDAAGLYIWQGNANHVSLTGCLIDGNVSASYGGGIYCYQGDLMLTDCVLTNNTGQLGGAIYGNGSSAVNTFRLTMDNCLVAGNDSNEDGGAIYGGSYALLVINNSTIADNIADYDGGGLYLNAATCWATMTDTILWSNTANATGHQIYASGASPIAFLYSDYANATGDIISSAVIVATSSISLDPLFVAGPDGAYYLSQVAAGQASDSPCLDAGSDTAVNLGLDALTTRTDEVIDAAVVDIGYHYKP